MKTATQTTVTLSAPYRGVLSTFAGSLIEAKREVDGIIRSGKRGNGTIPDGSTLTRATARSTKAWILSGTQWLAVA